MINESMPLEFYKIARKPNITLEECRDFILNIPDRVLNFFYTNFSIEVDNKLDIFFDKYRNHYYGMTLYIDNIILHNTKNSEIKHSNNYFDYTQPFAKYSEAVLRICSSLEKDHPLIKSFYNPKYLWINCELMLFKDALEDDGVLAYLGLDNKKPCLVGETEFRNLQKKFSEKLDPHNPNYYEKDNFDIFYNLMKYKICSIEEANINLQERPLNHLIYEAYLKAHKDTDYYNDFFKPFLRALASTRNISKSSEVYYSIFNLNGEVVSTEKHKNRRNP